MKATCPTCTAVAMVCTHAHAGAYKNIKLGECWGGAVYRILKALLSNGFKLLLAVRESLVLKSFNAIFIVFYNHHSIAMYHR